MGRNLKALLILIIGFLPLLLPIKVNAEEKDVSVNLSKEYHNCTIWVSATEGDVWDVMIYSPTNDQYECSYDAEENAYYRDFEYLSAGEWRVVINSDTVIPQTQITVKASVQNESTGNVTVAKSVAGLQIYVVDNKVVVEWTDDTCGNLCIKVFDTDTFKVLADVKTDDKYYECEFSDTVDKITVSVVPAQSQNIADAVYSITLKANYEPKGTVIYPDIYITNNQEFNCELSLQQTYTILTEINGHIENIGKYNEGSYPISLILEEGTNNIKIYLQEENGSRKSFATVVECDLQKPTLMLSKEYNGLVTSSSSITIEGTVADYYVLTINGVEQKVADNGFFSSECGLFDGNNNIEIVATDEAGNEISYTASITKGDTKGSASELASIITLVLYAVIIGGVIVFLKKTNMFKKKKTESESENNEEKGKQDK